MIELVKQRSIEGLHDELTVKTINQYFPYECVNCAIGGMRRKPISSNLHGHRVVPDGIGDEIEIKHSVQSNREWDDNRWGNI